MSIKPGIYIITTKTDDRPVSRNFAEDFSLNPKEVFALPKDLLPKLLKWTFRLLNNGNYILSVPVDAPTANINGLLFAVLGDLKPDPTEWKIEPQFHHGPNTYTIVEAKAPVNGWLVPFDAIDKPETQIAIQPLIVQFSDPPQYPPNQLFVITPAA